MKPTQSTVTKGSVVVDAPIITTAAPFIKTDSFVCTTATTLPATNYGQPRYSRIIINNLTIINQYEKY